MIKAIREDKAEQIINRWPMKPTAVFGLVAPGLAARVNARLMRGSVEAIARSNGRY